MSLEPKKISALPESGALTGNEMFPFVQSHVTKRGTLDQIAAYIGTGGTGWTAETANVTDGQRVVQQVVDWFGGTGEKPAVGQYIGADGFVNTIAQAKDIRGAVGAKGDKGDNGDDSGGSGAFSPINIVDYGMIGDGKERFGAMTAGSTTLTVAGANFSSFDIGKSVYVDDAITAGVRGTSNAFAIPGQNLVAEIVSIISATQVTLSVAAGVTVNGARTIWGTDNAATWNNLISSKQSPYNQISFQIPRGHYLTFSKISVPGSNVPGAKSISFEGETFPTQWFGTVTEDPLNHDGSIIQCLSQTPGDAIFRFEEAEGTYEGFSLIHPVFEKLNFRTYDQPLIDGIDAAAASHLIMDHVDVTTGVFSVIAKEPSPVPYDANGIRTPKRGNGALTHLRNVSVSGFWVGIEGNEHLEGDYVNVTCNWYGINWLGGDHSAHITHLIAQRNHRGMNWAGDLRVIIDLANFEHAADSQTTLDNAWQKTDADIFDPQDHGRGKVTYAVVLGGAGMVDTFLQTGGIALNVRSIEDMGEDGGAAPVSAVTLSGTTWDIGTSPIVEQSISSNQSYTISGGTNGLSRGTFYLTKTGSGTVQINGVSYDTRNNGTTAFSVAKLLNGAYYISPDYNAAFVSLPVASAPTNGVVDDSANTFNWTNASGYTSVSDYEYTLNGGSTYTAASAKPIAVGAVNKAIGQVGVRVKAVAGVSQASTTLFNSTAFTASGGGATTYNLNYDTKLHFVEGPTGEWHESGSSSSNPSSDNYAVDTTHVVPAQTNVLMFSTLASSDNNGILMGLDINSNPDTSLFNGSASNWRFMVSAHVNTLVFWEDNGAQQVNTSITLPFAATSLYGIRVTWSGGVHTAEAVYSVDNGATWQVGYTYTGALSGTDLLYAKMGATVPNHWSLDPKIRY